MDNTNNMIERLGGRSTFEDLLMIGLAEKIMEDSSLGKFYNKSIQDIAKHQTKFFTLVLLQDNDDYENLKNNILLNFFRFIEIGFNANHFDLLVQHFIEELQTSWVDDDTIQDVLQILNNKVRPVFESTDDYLGGSKNGRSLSSCKKEKKKKKKITSSSSLSSAASQHLKSSSSSSSSSRHNSGRKKVQRGSSGEFLLSMIRGGGGGIGNKRTKKGGVQ